MNKKTGIILLFLISFGAYSQEQWTLQDCVAKAENNSIRLKVAALETQVVEKNKQSIASYYLPEISLNGSQSYNFGSAIDPSTNSRVSSNVQSTQASVNSGISLFDYSTFVNHKRQSLAVDYASLSEQEVLFEYQLSVLRYFYDILELQAMLELQNLQLVNSKANLDRVQKEVDAGAKPKSDWYDIDFIYNNEVIAIEQSKNSLANLKLQLLHFLNVTDLKADEYSLVQFEEVVAPKSDYSFNPAIEKLQLNQQIIERDKQLIKLRNMPKLLGNYQYGSFYSKLFNTDIESNVASFSDQMGANKSHYASLNLSVPIFQGGVVRRQVRVKKEELKLNAMRIEESKVNLSNQITQFTQEVDQLDAIAVQLQNSIQMSEKTFATTQAKYENAKVDIFSFNAAKNQLLNAQFALKKNGFNQSYLLNKIKLYNSNTL